MFTGIVRAIGTITSDEDFTGEGRRLTVRAGALSDWRLELGSSLAVDGACLTVTEFGENAVTVEVSGETLDRTTLSDRRSGDRVNLEPSLRVGDEVGGHFVLGHVDTTMPVKALEDRGEFYDLVVEVPPDYRRYVAPKGCVALDGISLTVNEVTEDGSIRVRIVPHTYRETALADRRAGDTMNLEVDVMARYLYHGLGPLSGESQSVPFPTGPDEPSGAEGNDDPRP